MTIPASISLEFIQVQPQKLLGLELLAKIEAFREEARDGITRRNADALAQDLTDIVRKYVGSNVTVMVEPVQTIAMNSMPVMLSVGGASTVNYSPTKLKQITQEFVRKGAIDLRTGKLTGIFATFPAKIILNGHMLAGDKLTPEEATAILLHEIGHIYSYVTTIGDYTVLNYFLTEGVEVLLGKRPQEINTEMYSLKTLQENASQEKIREALKEYPTEENLRVAIVDAFKRQRRDQLGSSRGTARRDEQFADLYVSRQGYGRALATGLHKLDRMYGGRFFRTRAEQVALAVLKTCMVAMAIISPLTLIGFGLIELCDREDAPEPYDDPKERLQKIRNEQVSQLKQAINNEARAELEADIETIDTLLKNYRHYSTLVEMVQVVLRPGMRRRDQRLQQEQTLEQLLNNDLFISAVKFDRIK